MRGKSQSSPMKPVARLLPPVLALSLLAVAVSAQPLDVASPRPGQGVAQGDDVTLQGSLAGGGDKAYAWLFDAFAAAPGGLCRSIETNVTGGTFQAALAGLTDRTGDLTLVVQGLGADGRYADGAETGDGKLFGSPEKNTKCDDGRWVSGSTVSGKNGNDLLNFLRNNARKSGSDDSPVFQTLTFRVVAPALAAGNCPAVPWGQNITASGTTNRADGTVIQVRVTGPAPVTSRTTVAQSGSFSVSIPGAEMSSSGTYTVTFDDGRGNSATVVCPVTYAAGYGAIATPPPTSAPVSPQPPSPAPPTPTPEPEVVVATPPPPSPTPAATSPPPTPPPATSSPSPTPRQPGFELALAAGALGAACLARRRR